MTFMCAFFFNSSSKTDALCPHLLSDRATSALMDKPRCSLPDIIGTEDLLRRRRRRKRKKRYSLTGLSWPKTDITWRCVLLSVQSLLYMQEEPDFGCNCHLGLESLARKYIVWGIVLYVLYTSQRNTSVKDILFFTPFVGVYTRTYTVSYEI